MQERNTHTHKNFSCYIKSSIVFHYQSILIIAAKWRRRWESRWRQRSSEVHGFLAHTAMYGLSPHAWPWSCEGHIHTSMKQFLFCWHFCVVFWENECIAWLLLFYEEHIVDIWVNLKQCIVILWMNSLYLQVQLQSLKVLSALVSEHLNIIHQSLPLIQHVISVCSKALREPAEAKPERWALEYSNKSEVSDMIDPTLMSPDPG